MKWKWLTEWADEIEGRVRRDESVLACCGAATTSPMSDFTPRSTNGPAGRAEITGCRLFVHEYRCMAALADGAGEEDASLNLQDKRVGGGNDPAWPIPQMSRSRSGCLFPRETARRRGRRSRSSGCPVTSLRSAIPVAGASRGFRALSKNFIIAPDCATTLPDFSDSSRTC